MEPGCRTVFLRHQPHCLILGHSLGDRCIVHFPVGVSTPDVHGDDVLQLIIALRIALAAESLVQPAG